MYALIVSVSKPHTYYLAPGKGITSDRSKAHRYATAEEADWQLAITRGDGYRVEVVEEEDEVSVLRRRLKALPGGDH